MARSCLSVAHWLLLFILSTSSHAWNISAPTFPASIPSHALRRRAPYVYAESHPTWLNQTLNKWDNISVEAHGKRQIEQVELEATCSKKDLSLNFPRLFTLDDGRFSAAEILGRLRDQACAGICGPVPGIPEKLTQWQRQSTSGCEYAVKVGPKWELYLSASDAGANCRDSSTTAIERCMTEKNRSTRLKDGAKMEGPNDGEFYYIGIRPMDAKGSNHPAFPNNNDHLPYMQLSCRVRRDWWTWKYYVQIYGWNDDQNGATLYKALHKHAVHHIHWTPSPYKSFYYRDHTYSEHVFTFHVPPDSGNHMPEDYLDRFWDLELGSFMCQINVYKDVSIWLDKDYDVTSDSTNGVVIQAESPVVG